MKPEFYTSIHCTSGAHCTKCRQLGHGLLWREGITIGFTVYGGVDFTCPKSKTWTGSKKDICNTPMGIERMFTEAREDIEALVGSDSDVLKIKKWLAAALIDLDGINSCSSCAAGVRNRLLKSWKIVKRRLNEKAAV